MNLMFAFRSRVAPIAALLAGLCLGCETPGGTGADTPTPFPTDIDFDGDGFTTDEGDCNDLDRDIGPQAPERCDTVDNDCDRRVDEAGAIDALTFHADGDHDGWGDPDFTQAGCEPPPNFVANSGDCDDNRDDVRPGAPEFCDLADNDCDAAIDEGIPEDVEPFRPDGDGDGFGVDDDHVEACTAPEGYVADTGAEDCDDTNAAAYPGAAEVCDGVDNDCDTNIDEPGAEGAPTWYSDVDGDAFGDDQTAQTLCVGPDGWVTDGGDCNEGDANIHPAADERCGDDVDNDCDDEVDEGGAVDARPWFADLDEDGFGDPTLSFTACEPPVGYVAPNTDCDDTKPWINPDADEICTVTGQPTEDEDCDEAIDEATAIDASTWYLDADGDGFGSGDSISACEAPADHTTQPGDCDDGDAAVNPDAEEICNDGTDNNCDGGPGDCNLKALSPMGLDLADIKLIGEQAGALAGEDVALAGDINRDGYADLLVGAWSYDNGASGVDAGAVYVIYGPLWDRVDSQRQLNLADADVKLTGEGAGDHAGTAVGPAGDVNGDGYDDILIGASQASETRTWQGAVYLMYGPIAAGTKSLADADARFIGEGTGDFAGSFLAAAGDVNADTYDDLLIGAPGHDVDGRADAGAAYVVHGPVARGTHYLSQASVRLYGEKPGDMAGHGVGGGGDFNGDSIADLLIGAPFNDEGGTSEGKVYAIYGPVEAQGARALSTADVHLLGESLGRGGAGYTVASGGDLDADGYDEILVGAPMTDPVPGEQDNGTAYTIYGPVSGRRPISSPPDIYLDGSGNQDQAGIAVTAAADMNGDGYGDILVGSWRETDLSYRSGAVRLLYGPILTSGGLGGAPVVFFGEAEGDVAGISVDGGQDINGDGYQDIIIGAPGHDHGGEDAGAAYVIFGVGL